MAASFISPAWFRVSALRPRLHAHAQITRQRDRGQSWYAIRNAATGHVHRASPAVYQLIDLLDGNRTVAEAWLDVAERLDDAAPTQDEVIRLLAQLHDADLLQTDLTPDTAELAQRRARLARSSLWQKIGNPMSLRLPLWDPDRFLSRSLPLLLPLTGWFGLLLWAAIVLPAMVLAGLHWPELTDGATDSIFGTENLVLMALIFPVLKTLHEFGHAYTTKAGGGAVHEMGIMLLVLLPIPYVDASAASAFRSRARRVGVGAAGMLVETAVAGLAMMLWTLTEPGQARAALYAVMLTAGVSTVMFNGNPLLRYDGYFILSDLIGIPNLAARSSKHWAWLAQRWAFGVKTPAAAAARGERAWFTLFAPASFAARMMVLASITLVVAGKFFVIGILLAGWAVAMSVVWPLCRMVGYVAASPALNDRRGRAVSVSLAGLALLAGLVGLVPVPLHSLAEGVIWLPDESTIRAGGNGFVRRFAAQPGQVVQPGAVLAVSVDPEVDGAMAAGRARVASAAARVASQQFDDRVQAGLVLQELAVERAALARAQERADGLIARSASAGVFVVSKADDQLDRWVKRGEVIGYVLPDRVRTARVLVRQADIDLVRQRLRGAEVIMAFDLGRVWQAAVVREVPAASDELPSPALSVDGGGSQAADPRDTKRPHTLSRNFQFDVVLPEAAGAASGGGHVWVRFDHGTEPLALQAWRALRLMMLSHFDA